MMQNANPLSMRFRYIDVMKAVAIIAVVLYHMGISIYGYLGVDVFFVIAGFLTTKTITKQMCGSGAGYFHFLVKRVFRLLPMLLLASIVCIVFGWYFMLPDDYENVSESVIATNFFSNNIFQCITTKNYWDVVNEYKPLMHTWYVGVLMQFYIIFPLFFIIAKKISQTNHRKFSIFIISTLFIASLLLYLFVGTPAEKFYYLPWRLFEFAIGGLTAYIGVKKHNGTTISTLCVFSYAVLLSLLFVRYDFVSQQIRLILSVLCSCVLLYSLPLVDRLTNKLISNKYVAIIGMCSYSVFIWHQVVLAFIRYSFTNQITKWHILTIIIVIIAVLSFLSYRYIEKLQPNKITYSVIIVLFLIINSLSLSIYNAAGVVRNVPELDIYSSTASRGMHSAYNAIGFSYDKDFSSHNRKRWLVIGNSFGRDWINVILESPIKDSVEISYLTSVHNKNQKNRLQNADLVFVATLGVNETLIDEIKAYCNIEGHRKSFFIIGEKNFGVSNGIVYKNRYNKDYLLQTIDMESGYEAKNQKLKSQYGDCYIDMIKLVQMPDKKVRVFSNKGKFISQDCRHLTRGGAQYYASLISWKPFLDN